MALIFDYTINRAGGLDHIIIRNTLDTPLVTQILLLEICVTKGVSERFCYDPSVKKLNMNFIKFTTYFHPPGK